MYMYRDVLTMFAFYCQAIAGIAESWEQITLDIGPYKDRGHFRLKYVFISSRLIKKLIDLLFNFFI